MRVKGVLAVIVFFVACGGLRADPIDTITAALDFISPGGTESELFAAAFDWNGSTVSNMTFVTWGALGSSFSFVSASATPIFDSFRWTDPNGDSIALDFFEVNPEHILIQPFLLPAGGAPSWTPVGEIEVSGPIIFATPEPTTVWLFATGLVAIALTLRRRQRCRIVGHKRTGFFLAWH